MPQSPLQLDFPIELNFNPDQARDEYGRWAPDAGGSYGSSKPPIMSKSEEATTDPKAAELYKKMHTYEEQAQKSRPGSFMQKEAQRSVEIYQRRLIEHLKTVPAREDLHETAAKLASQATRESHPNPTLASAGKAAGLWEKTAEAYLEAAKSGGNIQHANKKATEAQGKARYYREQEAKLQKQENAAEKVKVKEQKETERIKSQEVKSKKVEEKKEEKKNAPPKESQVKSASKTALSKRTMVANKAAAEMHDKVAQHLQGLAMTYAAKERMTDQDHKDYSELQAKARSSQALAQSHRILADKSSPQEKRAKATEQIKAYTKGTNMDILDLSLELDDIPLELAGDSGDGQWITISGAHVLVGHGEDKDEAVKRFIGKKEDGEKEKSKPEPSNKQLKQARDAFQKAVADKNKQPAKTHEDTHPDVVKKFLSSKEGQASRSAYLASHTAYGSIKKAVGDTLSALHHKGQEKLHRIGANLHQVAGDLHGLVGNKAQAEHHASQAAYHAKDADFHKGEHGKLTAGNKPVMAEVVNEKKGKSEPAASEKKGRPSKEEFIKRMQEGKAKRAEARKTESSNPKQPAKEDSKEESKKQATPEKSSSPRERGIGGSGGAGGGSGGGGRGGKGKKGKGFKPKFIKPGKSMAMSLSIEEANQEEYMIFPDDLAPAIELGGKTTVDGKPVQRFRKEIIREGQFTKQRDGITFQVTPNTLNHWAATFSQMKDDGVKVYFPEGHTNAPGKNRGWWQKLEVAPSSKNPRLLALYGEVDAIGEDGIGLIGRSDVSLYAPGELVAGNGKKYSRPIVHIAACTDPVIPGLGDWEAVAASLTPFVPEEEELELAAGDGSAPYLEVLAILMAQRVNYHSSHWASRGEDFYEDHQLFERLYNDLTDQIDPLGEKIVALFGEDKVDPLVLTKAEQDWLDEWSHVIEAKARGLQSEEDLMDAIEIAVKDASQGMQNYLQDLADKHETNIYLLQQGKEDLAASLNLSKQEQETELEPSDDEMELSQGSITNHLPRGSTMNIVTICEKLGIPVKNDQGEVLINADNAEALILGGIDNLFEQHAQEKEALVLSSGASEKQASPALMRLVCDNRMMKLNNLVTAQHITPAVAKALHGEFNSEENLTLCLSDDGVANDHFDAVVKILAQNKPVSVEEVSKGQTVKLSSEAEEAVQPQESCLVKDAEERAKKAEEQEAKKNLAR